MKKPNGHYERFYYRNYHCKPLMTDVIVIDMTGVTVIHQVNMAEVPLFISLISHIYLTNDSNMSHINNNNINHHWLTVVVPCSKSAHSAHRLFLIYFFYNLNEYLKVASE